jgi:hypothetical protein
MRNALGLILLFSLGSAQAAPVTIDFEEFAVGYYDSLTSGDYVMDASYSCDSSQAPLCAAQVTSEKTFRIYGEPNFFPVFADFNMKRSDGGAFAVHSMDSILGYGGDRIHGTTAAGDFISGDVVDLGQGDWLNLVKFRYRISYPSATPVPAIIEIDNIVVSAVPIPAAVWLFGSALAGLGWMRRRKTV